MLRSPCALLFLGALIGCQVSENPASEDDQFASTLDLDGDGQSPSGGDCNDANPYVYSGAPEVCDNLDNDCDLLTDDEDQGRIGLVWMFDGDGDGYGREATSGDAQYVTACSIDTFEELVENTGGDPAQLAFYVSAQYDVLGDILVDCDDANADMNPGESEICDGFDNDCDELIDEGVPSLTAFYLDADADGWGDPLISAVACEAPTGYVADATDCNDGDVTINPGATEVCDSADTDEDCNSLADDNDSGVDPSTQSDWFVDDDNDGWGDPPSVLSACDDPSGQLVLDGTDCDDSSAGRYPGAPETCNGIDDDCDTAVPVTETDDDSDGQSECMGDCDDLNAARFPGNPETCDGIDNDCDLMVPSTEIDDDSDGQSECMGDCDDGSAARFTGNPEICDAIDNDCDSAVPTSETSDDSDSQSECEGDCDDTDGTVYTGAPEICDDQRNDCTSAAPDVAAVDQITWSRDVDGDLYGNSSIQFTSCDAPSGFTEASGDCNDNNAAMNPGATEVFDGLDNDCDGSTDEGTSCATSIVIVNDGGEALSIDGVSSDNSALDGEWFPGSTPGVTVTPTSLGGDDWDYEATMDLCITPTGTVLVDAEFTDGSTLCEGMVATAIIYASMDAITLDVVAYDNLDGTCQVELSRP